MMSSCKFPCGCPWSSTNSSSLPSKASAKEEGVRTTLPPRVLRKDAETPPPEEGVRTSAVRFSALLMALNLRKFSSSSSSQLVERCTRCLVFCGVLLRTLLLDSGGGTKVALQEWARVHFRFVVWIQHRFELFPSIAFSKEDSLQFESWKCGAASAAHQMNVISRWNLLSRTVAEDIIAVL